MAGNLNSMMPNYWSKRMSARIIYGMKSFDGWERKTYDPAADKPLESMTAFWILNYSLLLSFIALIGIIIYAIF